MVMTAQCCRCKERRALVARGAIRVSSDPVAISSPTGAGEDIKKAFYKKSPPNRMGKKSRSNVYIIYLYVVCIIFYNYPFVGCSLWQTHRDMQHGQHDAGCPEHQRPGRPQLG